jgi:thiol-disulfide isomerase/thioredoxin
LAAGAGVLAAAGGATLAWRRSQRQSETLADAEKSFWQQQFVQLDGASMAMAAFRGRPLLLNFWATWCPPCIEELPLLNAFFSEHRSKSWQVLGLAVDQSAPVKRFLTQTPLLFPVALAGFAGVELSRSLGNLSGGLPFTAVFDAAGRVVHRQLGRLSAANLVTVSALAEAR